MASRDLVDVGEASRLNGLARPTLYRLARQGQLRSFRVLRRGLRFERAESTRPRQGKHQTLGRGKAVSTHASRTLEHARLLLGLGFSVIPLDHPDDPIANDPNQRGKVPGIRWAPFQQARPTDDNLVEWFGNGRTRNIGIVTGAISNVVFVDTDNAEAEAWAQAHLPATPIQTITAKGIHRGYRHPGKPVPTKARIRDGIDIRGDGGYVVGPGSQHVSGHVYRAPHPWPDSLDTVPVFNLAWLGLDNASGPAWTLSATPRTVPRLDRDALLRHAQAHLKKTPPAIQGQGGDAHTFQVACHLVRGFDLSDLDALESLRDWNQRCVPPWTHADLVAKVERARKYGDEPIGGRIGDSRYVRSLEERRTASSPAAGIAAPAEPDMPTQTEAPDSLILDPGDPLPSARAFIAHKHLANRCWPDSAARSGRSLLRVCPRREHLHRPRRSRCARGPLRLPRGGAAPTETATDETRGVSADEEQGRERDRRAARGLQPAGVVVAAVLAGGRSGP